MRILLIDFVAILGSITYFSLVQFLYFSCLGAFFFFVVFFIQVSYTTIETTEQ